MEEWIERIVIAVIVVFLTVACVDMYSTWSDCKDAGGVTVRGMFGLECIRR